MNNLKGKHIVLGITGSIAAYKSCTLVRLLVKSGCEVQVVITPSGKQFITPTTLAALTGKPVVSEFFSQNDGTWHSHVDLGQWADLMVIAPTTAATLAKMAHGIADNMLITTYLSMKAPVFVAPAMDLDMYSHPSTRNNIELLKSYGNFVIEPTCGELASHLVGKGRMEEPETIYKHICGFFENDKRLAGKKILITLGPTHEKIDPVRFIGNYSSGKMGWALAKRCAQMGAYVKVIAGPVSDKLLHENVEITEVVTAEEMYNEAVRMFTSVDAAIMCAAVADYTPTKMALEKKKREESGFCLELIPTKDIAGTLGNMKKKNQVLVGFALETNNESDNARVKLKKKNLDFIVLNSLNDKGAGFQHDTNKITIISDKKETAYPLKSKDEVALDIVNELCSIIS